MISNFSFKAISSYRHKTISILNEILFHADAYRDNTINSDDFKQAVDAILDERFEQLLTEVMNQY